MITLSLQSVQVDDATKLIARRGLQQGGPVALFFANEVARMADPYVPMRTGMLKNAITISPGYIVYRMPYAEKNWYQNRGADTQGTQKGGKRGPRWALRMWHDKGPQIVRAVARKAGGTASV